MGLQRILDQTGPVVGGFSGATAPRQNRSAWFCEGWQGFLENRSSIREDAFDAGEKAYQCHVVYASIVFDDPSVALQLSWEPWFRRPSTLPGGNCGDGSNPQIS